MKIVAIPSAHALAHISRLLEVSKVLLARGHEILFAGFGKYLGVAATEGFETRNLPHISIEQVLRAIRSQRLWEIYPEEQLHSIIAGECALLEEVKPDLVLLDNRPTARTSADMLGLRTAAVLNVHMSNYRRIPFASFVQMTGWDDSSRLDWVDRVENRVECWMYDRLVMRGLNRIRQREKLKRLYAYEHEEGDLSLFADLPEFNPVSALPPHARYVGPLTWHNTLPPPACLAHIDPERPLAYFTLGSDSLDELVTGLGALTKEGIQVVVATGSAVEHTNPARDVFLERFVNTDLLLPHCAIVCCHGGNGTLYQALGFGLPLVAVATHAEQYYGGKRLAQLGLGRATTLKRLRRQGMEALVAMVRDVLGDRRYRERAETFSQFRHGHWGPEVAADQIERWAGWRA